MISNALYAIQTALAYLKNNPSIQFAFVLLLVLPIAFLFTSNQFLEAGRSNQDKLQRDRFGLLHDSFIAMLRTSNYDAAVIQQEIEAIAAINPDITKFRLVRQTGSDFVVVAALDQTIIGQSEGNPTLYQTAAVRFDESLLFPFRADGVRYWQGVRATQNEAGNFFYLLTENSFAVVDAYLKDQERKAYMSLAIMYAVLLAIAYWLIRLTNYRGLYEEAEQAIATKDMFSNMIAHELRAPLTAIRGYGSMIEESTAATADHHTHAIRIKDSAERLLTIVNDLLDVARIQSGKLAISKEEVSVAPLAQAVVDELQSSAELKGITLSVTGDLALLAIADPKRLHQVLTNIVSNSIKYTPEGVIELEIAEQSNAVELRIKDTGMGISAEDQKQLFAPFFRVDSTDVSAITGTGLGMWITRQLVELMGAKIGVESIKGVGTHVVVVLPKSS